MSASRAKNESSISHATTEKGIAEFWETNSLDDHWDEGQDVSFDVRAQRRRRVTLDPAVYARLAKEAQFRGIAAETLINLWLAERLGDVSEVPEPVVHPPGSASS